MIVDRSVTGGGKEQGKPMSKGVDLAAVMTGNTVSCVNHGFSSPPTIDAMFREPGLPSQQLLYHHHILRP